VAATDCTGQLGAGPAAGHPRVRLMVTRHAPTLALRVADHEPRGPRALGLCRSPPRWARARAGGAPVTWCLSSSGRALTVKDVSVETRRPVSGANARARLTRGRIGRRRNHGAEPPHGTEANPCETASRANHAC
jgi:hypothetical protein